MGKKVEEKKKHYDVGRIVIKIMAAILALIMLVATAGTLIYYIVYATV